MITRVRTLRFALLACALAAASVASAQPASTSQSDRDTARRLATEGIQASQRNDWATAIDRLENAERLFHAPVHLQYLAQGYEHTGHLRQAADTWRRLSRETLAPDAPQPFRDAVQTAGRELPRVEALLGRIVLELPAGVRDLSVLIDGQPVASMEVAAPQFVDPGSHRVMVNAPGRPAFTRTVDIRQGATERVRVDLGPDPSAARAAPPRVRTTTVYRANPLRTVGIVVGGAGIAAGVVGIITGLMASSKFSDLESSCPMRQCSTDPSATISSIDSLAGLSSALLIGGGVLAATGAVLFIVGSPRAEQVQVTVAGPSLQLRYSF